MSKIWKAIKSAWIYNLSLFLIGSILVAGQIKEIKATSQQKQLTVNSKQLTINNNINDINIKQKDNNQQTPISASSPAPNVEKKIAYEQTDASLSPTETKVLDAQQIEIPKSQYATVNIAGVGEYQTKILPDETAFTIMIRAARENNFSIDYKIYSFGAFITAIGGLKPADNEFWALYYNGVFSQVGASQLKIKDGDRIEWRIEQW